MLGQLAVKQARPCSSKRSFSNRGFENQTERFREGTSPHAGGGRSHGLVVESFPIRGSSLERLGDISHVGEGVLQLSHFRVEPALTAAMSSQVRF